MGGRQVTAGLCKHENFGGQIGCHMGAVKCLIDSESDCRTTRSVYQTICQTCEDDPTVKTAKYVGTSGRQLHSRQLEHANAIRRGQNNSALAKHQMSKHRQTSPRYKTTVIQGGIKFNLDRFVREALEIDSAKDDQNFYLLNQRSEWGNSGLPKLSLT